MIFIRLSTANTLVGQLCRPKQQLNIKSQLHMPSWPALSALQTPWLARFVKQNNNKTTVVCQVTSSHAVISLSSLQTSWSASCADQNNSLSIILHLYMLPETSSLSMLHRPKQQLYIKSPLYMPSPSWSALSSMQTPWETSSADQNNSSKSNYIFTCHNELLQNRHHGQDHGW